MARPTSGRITLKEREITSLPERFLTDIRRKTFGFMFQQFHLIKGITAIENVMIPAYPDGEKHAVLKKRAIGLLDLLNLSHKASAKVEWLSGGEAQRIAIARALINDPAIIIADEPTAHLDTHLSREFMEIMRRLKEQGKTLLIASHDPIVYESDVIDRIVDMRDGRVSPGAGDVP
jgi:putative ABC transport system ATP-binding protein